MFKKIIFLCLLGAVFLSCRRDPIPGPQGPRGPQGPQGVQGAPGPEAFVWETQFSFTAPTYKSFWYFPNTFETLESDVVLVYFLWEVDEQTGMDVWKPLPLTLFEPSGNVHYSYEFTMGDVAMQMQVTDPVLFEPRLTDNWIARIVLVPGGFARLTPEVMADYHKLKETFGLPELAVPANAVIRK